MRIGSIQVKRRVWVGLAGAVGVVGVWWGWVQGLPPKPTAVPPAQTPFVRLTGQGSGVADRVLRERADLFDPTPLFFPTEWNYGQQPLKGNLRRQPGQVFGSFEPSYTFAEQGMKPHGPETAPPPEKLSDLLAQGNEAPFAGIGQMDLVRPKLEERSGFLEVRGFGGDNLLIAQTIKDITPPQADYSPLEFLVVVNAAGMIGAPVLTSGSGREEEDDFFRTYLVKTARLGGRLGPGRYRVLVGP